MGTVGLVARREIVERVREKSFLIATAVNIIIIVAVVIVIALLGGGEERYAVGYVDDADTPVVLAAAEAARALDIGFESHQLDEAQVRTEIEEGDLDAALVNGRILAEDDPPDELVALLQSASAQARAVGALEEAGVSGAEAQEVLRPEPLQVTTLEPQDDDAAAKAGVAFFAVLILYGQLITYGYWVSSGVVEEKASRVVEVILSTIRPAQLLAGKVIGIGLLGLGNLLLTAAVGLGVAQATGALSIDGDILVGTALALVWFLVGYAFYSCAFACAGALVPRQEELQSSMTPLSLTILVSFFVAFAVLDAPDGTLAKVTAFIPITAPITMPPRIVTGDAATWEIVLSLAITLGAAALLIPLAARIYEGGVLRTGSALKLREAWRAARS